MHRIARFPLKKNGQGIIFAVAGLGDGALTQQGGIDYRRRAVECRHVAGHPGNGNVFHRYIHYATCCNGGNTAAKIDREQ